MSDTTAETLKRFAKFRDLAGGDPVAGALLVLACAISEPKGLDEPASLLGIDDVAKRLGVSTGTIRGLIKNGLLPASRVGSGRGTLRVDPEELRRFQKQSAGANWRG